MRLRLTHPLGTQDFELDSRSADDPIIIGRANDADVKVPSVSVSRAHAAIFVHDGQWIVQDSGSRDGTFVNGAKIDVPTRLSLNDRIGLGPGNAASVQILSLDSPDAAAVSSTPIAAASDHVDSAGDDEVDSDEASVAFDAAAPAPVGYVPRPRKKSATPMIITMSVAGVVIVGSIGLAIWGYYRYQAKMDAIAAAKAVPPAPTTVQVIQKPVTSERKGMFSEAIAPRPTPVAPAPTPVAPAPAVPTPVAPATAAPSTVAPAANPVEPATDGTSGRTPTGDKWRDSPDWEKVLEARDASPLPIAILIYLDYKQQFKDSPLVKDADAFIAEALDRLWWERVTQLIESSKQMENEIAELKKEKLTADDKDRKAQIDRQIKDLLDRLATNKLLRDDMKVVVTAPPNLHDEAAMATLRKARDAAAFETWSQRVLGRIKSTRGAAPW